MLTYQWKNAQGKYVYLSGENNPYDSQFGAAELEGEVEKAKKYSSRPRAYMEQFNSNVAPHIGMAGNTTAWTQYYTSEVICGDYVVNFVENSGNTVADIFTYGNVSLNSAIYKGSESTADGEYSLAVGYKNYAEGNNSIAAGEESHTYKTSSVAIGQGAEAKGKYSSSIGVHTKSENDGETSFGKWNISHSSSTSSATTLFSVGNGTDIEHRSNTFEIMQNGDVYALGVGGWQGYEVDKTKTLKHAIENAVNIKQTTGNSKTSVMSQSAVTNAIQTIAENNNKFQTVLTNKISAYTESGITIQSGVILQGLSDTKTLQQYILDLEYSTSKLIAELNDKINDLQRQINN